MNASVFHRRPPWSLVAVLVSVTALLATVIALRAAPRTSAGMGRYQLLASTSGVHVVGRVKLKTGERAVLYQNNAFKVVAICVDNGAGVFTAEYGVRALEDNTLVFSTDQGNETDTRLDKADGLFHWSSYQASSATPLFYGYDYYQEFTGESLSGRLLIGRVSSGVHMRGAACVYDGLFID